ncbi:hypothetical protein P171DRAFT_440295 [Karstenula rhodostoma CBS 690.94]|uniref:Uncharacterized protein n=1 Tax=Karstenula rhodostoma CBS 690.94 TaxID=1392251 RepID=A0A9P4PW32_9PLEO|nr:hypothetical protein P171DRAFT_440295 [Karstenula rhodostoma CBS 690.94]
MKEAVRNCCESGSHAAANNWKGHIRGLLSLVHQHPPAAFSHAGAHEVFLECRYNGVTSALSNRKAIFPSRPGCISVPWKTRQKDAIDTAMDILVKFLGVLEEWDLLSTRKFTEETLRRVRVFKYQRSMIDHELLMWYSSFVSVFEHAYPIEA